MKGNPEPVKKLCSQHASSLRSDGVFVGSGVVAKYVTPELAYIVGIERARAKVGGNEEITPYALRATNIFRRENGEWKLVHRHADPITAPRPAESVIQE
jgi:ketosteroid isomerase-like protein